jgi:hypothetical protein
MQKATILNIDVPSPDDIKFKAELWKIQFSHRFSFTNATAAALISCAPQGWISSSETHGQLCELKENS